MGDPSLSLRIRLVPDQPVEGVELTPDVFVQGGDARVEFHWYASTEKQACSWCGKTPVTMQRLTDSSYYCSVGCFVSAWPGHAAQHRTGLTQRGPRNEDAPADAWSGLDNDSTPQSSEQKWIEVADTQSYTPTSDDVGHMLKLVRRRSRCAASSARCAFFLAAAPPPTRLLPRPAPPHPCPHLATSLGAPPTSPRPGEKPSGQRRAHAPSSRPLASSALPFPPLSATLPVAALDELPPLAAARDAAP